MEKKIFKEFGYRFVDWIADYLSGLENYPVLSQVKPGEKPADGKSDRTQINFTVPVVSKDGAEALVLETGLTGQGGQVAIAVHLRKGKDGAWTEADSLLVTAIARSLPARTWGSTASWFKKNMGMVPASKSLSMGLPPL